MWYVPRSCWCQCCTCIVQVANKVTYSAVTTVTYSGGREKYSGPEKKKKKAVLETHVTLALSG